MMARKGGESRKGKGTNRSTHNLQINDMGSANADRTNEKERDAFDCEISHSYSEDRSDYPGLDAAKAVQKEIHLNCKLSSIRMSNGDGSLEKQAVDTETNIRDTLENGFLSSASVGVRDDCILSSSDHHGSSVPVTPIVGKQENILEKKRCLIDLAASVARAFVLFAMELTDGVVNKCKPMVTIFVTFSHHMCGHVHHELECAYPVVRMWILNAGKLIHLWLMIWLQLNLRGFDSLIHSGTVSIFAVLWCSFLSIAAIVGVKSIIIFLVVAACAFTFLGLGVAVLLALLFASFVLWVHGSFWITSSIIVLGGFFIFTSHERLAFFISAIYSMYCAQSYVGWSGLFLGLNLSFISNDVAVNAVKKNINDERAGNPSMNTEQDGDRSGCFCGDAHSPQDNAYQSEHVCSVDRQGEPSTSGVEKELTSGDEVTRLLQCPDHYSVFGVRRYQDFELSWLKKVYKKKAMLVHPDKNMDNEKAAEAFKKLQNAYEVLLDSLKRKIYDDELRREELLTFLRTFESAYQKKQRKATSGSSFSHSRGPNGSSHGFSQRISCRKCGGSHLWVYTEKSKPKARWCQDCKDHHAAKDGDGWVEQTFQPFFFGFLQKLDLPCAYACDGSMIYDVTEWFNCQGLKCAPNTHKPGFQVNTNHGKQSSNSFKGSAGGSTRRSQAAPNSTSFDENMTEEEFFEWLQSAVQSGAFDSSTVGDQNDSSACTGSTTGNSTSGSSKKKKKLRKQR